MWNTYDANGDPVISPPLGYTLTSRTIIAQGTTTYTVPTGTRAIFVECIAGGGSGGSAATAVTNSAAAGGGGGGAYSAKWILAPKTTAYTVAVGAGGTAPSAGANDGNNGNDTTFDSPSVVTAKAGLGGKQDAVATIHVGGLGGAGGAASSGVGDVKVDGTPGSTGYALAAAQAMGGNGGGGWLGSGGAIGKKNTTGGGNAGGSYGGGGSGASIISGGANQAGGAGGNGVIIVWEFA